MWLWLLLGALLIGIAWALKYALHWPLLIPIVATAAITVLVALIWILKWYLALRAAKKLQDVIENQGNQQAMNARPERRAEIQELRKQLLAGLSALKSSKLGRGGKRGGAALYTMPWYMIIGPPGAGKTTALTHSGLVFPYGSSSGPGGQGGGGGIRGVGGTRNCDWWFTNEAILLDTAGRYTTEQDDREEWISFLNFLKKYRPKRPINGVIIAISISELIDANEMQIEATGKKLRARIDEVAAQLHMVLPVYLLFTKVDLIAGFSEFFGDMRKSDRTKAWGATIKLELPKNEPGKIFGAEFDTLVKHLHARCLKRMCMERGREVRERLYQFPLEFTGLKRNLQDLVAVTFQPNNISGTPIFRGFYFTSGTQEGRPMDRVLERMSAAMGIRHQNAQQQQQAPQPAVESKSYFLHDVFMTVIFPDGDIAARSSVEERRQAVMKLLIAGATFAFAAILAFPSITSYLNNKSFIATAETNARKAAAIKWEEGDPFDNVRALNPTLETLKKQDELDKKVPFEMGWPMYVADQVRRPTLKVFSAEMQTGFVNPVRKRLEEKLRKVTGQPGTFLDDWLTLRLYLMLFAVDGKMDHLDVDWATGRYSALWAKVLKETSRSGEEDLKREAKPHVAYYFEVLKAGRIKPMPADTELVAKVQSLLGGVSLEVRYFDLLVRWLSDQRIDEAGETWFANLTFPPLDLSAAFPARQQDILDNGYDSKLRKQTKALNKDGTNYYRVPGFYTAKGYQAVMMQIERAEGLLKSEQWVVPLTKNETPEAIARSVKDAKAKYEAEYTRTWTEFFVDMDAKKPSSDTEARESLRVISLSPSPLSAVLELLDRNTQWREEDLIPSGGNDGNKSFRARMERYEKLVAPSAELKEIAKPGPAIPSTFAAMVRFGRPDPTGATVPPGSKYTNEIAANLKLTVVHAQDANGGGVFLGTLKEQFAAAYAQADDLLTKNCDKLCVTLLRPILLDPLTITERPAIQGVDPKKVESPVTPGSNRPVWDRKKDIPKWPPHGGPR